MVKRLFDDFVRAYRVLPKALQRSVIRMFVCVVLQAVLEIAGILAISVLAMSLAGPERLLSHPVAARIMAHFPTLIDYLGEQRFFSLIMASLAVLLIAIKNGVSAVVSIKTNMLGERLSLFAGDTVFRNFLHSPYIKHLSGEGGKMFQALSRRGDLGRMVVHQMAVYTYAAIALAMTCMLVLVTPGAVLLTMIGIISLAVVVYRYLRRSVDTAGSRAADMGLEESRATMNAMNGIREALIYRQQDVFFERYHAACANRMGCSTLLNIAPSLPTWVLETAGFASIPATLWIMSVWQGASMSHITGILTMLMLVAWRVLPLVNRTLSALVVVRSSRYAALDCLSRVEQIMEEPAEPLPEPDPHFVMKEGISLERVSFQYPGSENLSLEDITFAIPRGARVGIVGKSGAGKSSLATILSGLVEPTGGEFRIDGRCPTPQEMAAYRQHVGYVPQNPYILSGTLAENVAFSQWGKPWDEERVLQACRLAELDIVAQRGILLPLGEGGAGLSGGQIQRLSLARALYAEPSVLILDEATSALDSAVEAAIMDTLFALPQSITTIAIAHRLSTVERCDLIVWLDQGRIRGMGPGEKVLADYRAFLHSLKSEG